MKKSLIALAVLAAFGTAHAQSTATISGKFGVAVGKRLGSDANVHVSDGNVTVAAVEDLGGGMKAGASIDMRTRGREQNVATATGQEIGRDATVYVSGGFGTVALGSVEAANGIMGLGLGGAQQSLASGWDGNILSGPAYANILQWTSPSISGFSVNLTHVDSIGSVATNNTTTTSTGAVLLNYDYAVAAQQIGVAYNNGPISAIADYAVFSNQTSTTSTLTSAADRSRIRASASYDLGVMKIGVGFEDNKGTIYTSASSATAATAASYDGNQMIVGASVPVGPLLLGAAYARNSESGVVAGATSNGDEVAKGWLVSANYAFSKRTALLGTYSDIKRSGGAAFVSGYSGASTAGTTVSHATNAGAQYRIRLMHSF